jgi:hypothetical protein
MVYNRTVVAPAEWFQGPSAAVAMHRSTLLALFFLFSGQAAPARAQASATPADTVPPQTVVPQLANFMSLATVMNLARGTVRIVAVVSPSSPGAAKGMDVIDGILRDIPSKRFRAYVILTHALAADSQARALDLAARHPDRRIVYVWDPAAAVAKAVAPIVGLAGEPVYNVFLLYDTDAAFTTSPATPVLWMHLHPGIDGPPLEDAPLRVKADELVRAVEKKAGSGAP